MSHRTSLGPGDSAPDFELPDQSGKLVRLSTFRGRRVVLFFYPKDHTPACTAQACSFRDATADLKAHGAVILGISGDKADTHAGFADRHQLPFPLLSDRDGQTRASFGVPRTWGLFPGRVSYLIDEAGIIRAVHNSQFRPGSHVPAMLAGLQALVALPSEAAAQPALEAGIKPATDPRLPAGSR